MASVRAPSIAEHARQIVVDSSDCDAELHCQRRERLGGGIVQLARNRGPFPVARVDYLGGKATRACAVGDEPIE